MKKMNPHSKNNNNQGGSYDRETEEWLTAERDRWDISAMLNSLPTEDKRDDKLLTSSRSSSSSSVVRKDGRSSSRKQKKTVHSDEDQKQEERKVPASLKRSHNENMTLKAVPKYEWRSNSPSPQQTQQNQQNDTTNNAVNSPEPFLTQDDDFERSMIEVFPGVDVPLRGSFETQQAIRRNFIVRVNCMDCTLSLCCIRNAEYVLCPLCHCVSPLELSCSNVMEGSFGVGLGFVEDDR